MIRARSVTRERPGLRAVLEVSGSRDRKVPRDQSDLPDWAATLERLVLKVAPDHKVNLAYRDLQVISFHFYINNWQFRGVFPFFGVNFFTSFCKVHVSVRFVFCIYLCFSFMDLPIC